MTRGELQVGFRHSVRHAGDPLIETFFSGRHGLGSGLLLAEGTDARYRARCLKLSINDMLNRFVLSHDRAMKSSLQVFAGSSGSAGVEYLRLAMATAFEEYAQNGSRPRHRWRKFLDLLAARNSALCAPMQLFFWVGPGFSPAELPDQLMSIAEPAFSLR
jgi:hypothetical protein